MPTLGEMLKPSQMAALEDLKPGLESRRLREEADPLGVAVDHLVHLMTLCSRYERKLPKAVRDHLKVTVAAMGRAGI